MKIKLHARLAAYSKIYNINEVNLPSPTTQDAGKFVGIDRNGNYTLFNNATSADIDTLFEGNAESKSTKNSLIDSLFDK